MANRVTVTGTVGLVEPIISNKTGKPVHYISGSFRGPDPFSPWGDSEWRFFAEGQFGQPGTVFDGTAPHDVMKEPPPGKRSACYSATAIITFTEGKNGARCDVDVVEVDWSKPAAVAKR